MGIRVSVGASKNGQTIFHKLMYYGPVRAEFTDEGKLKIIEGTGRVLAIINDWIYLEYTERCEDNRKQYKELEHESSI